MTLLEFCRSFFPDEEIFTPQEGGACGPFPPAAGAGICGNQGETALRRSGSAQHDSWAGTAGQVAVL